jgi:hypothetical protein
VGAEPRHLTRVTCSLPRARSRPPGLGRRPGERPRWGCSSVGVSPSVCGFYRLTQRCVPRDVPVEGVVTVGWKAGTRESTASPRRRRRPAPPPATGSPSAALLRRISL